MEDKSLLIASEVRTSNRGTETGRSADFYCKVFNYDKHDLKGKLILDVGSGSSNFADFASKFGAEVVRLDPTYQDNHLSGSKNKVTGLVQAIPFKDGIFDETIASYSIYWVITDLIQSLKEMVRVTKISGSIKIHPAVGQSGEDLAATRDWNFYDFKDLISFSYTGKDATLTINKQSGSEDRINKLLETLPYKVWFGKGCDLKDPHDIITR